jgi:hypothetical protein
MTSEVGASLEAFNTLDGGTAPKAGERPRPTPSEPSSIARIIPTVAIRRDGADLEIDSMNNRSFLKTPIEVQAAKTMRHARPYRGKLYGKSGPTAN